jgi:glutaredoxin 3
MSKSITMYTMTTCPYCNQAKTLLTQRGLEWKEILIDDSSDEEWDALCAKSGMKTVPQIFAGDQLVGGYTELAALDKKDQLGSLK